MLKFDVNNAAGPQIVNLPTSLADIKADYLKSVTNEIVVADNYSLIAICYKEKLSSFIMAGRSKKNNISTAVIPLFVKHGSITSTNSTIDFIAGLNTADKLIIAGADIATGLHVGVPANTLTMNHLLSAIEGDSYAYQRAAAYKDNVYFVEYKIVPNCAIKGVYKPTLHTPFVNPFAVEIVAADIEK